MCLLAISQNKIQLQNESLPLPKAFKRKVLQTLKATKNKNEREGGGKGKEGKKEIKNVHPSCKGSLTRTSTWASNVTTVKRDHLLNFKICLKWSDLRTSMWGITYYTLFSFFCQLVIPFPRVNRAIYSQPDWTVNTFWLFFWRKMEKKERD